MKYLKLYESFSDIDKICKKYDIENYTINSDGSVDVDGDVSFTYQVNLSGKNLTKLPLKFRNVTGYFYCNPKLTSLEGSPESVGGDFNCSNTPKLTSLEGSPKSVGGDFDCSDNPNLTSLEGSPKSVGGYFYCSDNPKLTSLEGSPEFVGGNFYCRNNPNLTSLEGSPESLGGGFYCYNTPTEVIWNLFEDYSKIELFNDYDILRGDHLVLDRLNMFLSNIGKDPVKSVEGWKCV